MGERGVSLSGGQKARINLARAVYRQADIYLLDDPLSAVDSHVGRHLFENCIKTYLKDKLVILITHQLQYLPAVDQIVLLDKGNVQGVGTFDSLRDSGLDFAKLLPEQEKQVSDTENEKLSRQVSNISKNSERSFNRHNSVSSTNSHDSKSFDDLSERQVQEEKSAEGSIGWTLYNSYIQAAGGYTIFIFVLIMFVLAQLAASGGDYFVQYWVSKEEQRNTQPQITKIDNQTISYEDIIKSDEDIIDKVKQFAEAVMSDPHIDIYIFTALTIATVALTLSRSFLFFNVAMKASKALHDAMFSGITRATMYFFNTNPSGNFLKLFLCENN